MKKLFSFRLPAGLMDVVDKTAAKQFKTRTQFIEDAMRAELNKLNIKTSELKQLAPEPFEKWGWEEKPKLRKII